MESLLSILRTLDQRTCSDDRENYEYFYRGVENITYTSIPTLFRKPDGLDKESLIFNELIRNYPEELGNARAIDIIAFMQHYGNCSRMLDVTMNALMALFFACGGWNKGIRPHEFQNNLKHDGAIRIFKVPKKEIKYVDSETVALLSNIARIDNTKVRTFYEFEWECERDQKGVWHKYEDRQTLLQKNVRDVNKVVLVKSNLSNPRVRAQFGAFFLFGGLDGVQGLEHATQKQILEKSIKKTTIDFPKEYLCGDVCVPKSQKEHILELLRKYFSLDFSTICPEKHDLVNSLVS